MKKLLKSEVYKIHEQCTGALFTAKKSKHAAGNKKIKKKERKETQTWIRALLSESVFDNKVQNHQKVIDAPTAIKLTFKLK